MIPIPLRLAVSLSLLAVLGWPAAALANHHSISGGSSSGGGSDPDADCLVWGYVVADAGSADRPDAADGSAAGADASMSDGGDVTDAGPPMDAGTNDGGVPVGAKLVCLEHATMFGCDCSAGSAGEGSSRAAIALAAAALVAARRRRRSALPRRAP